MIAARADVALIAAGPAFAAVLSELHRQCFDEVWSERTFQELLAQHGTVATLATAQENPVGFVMHRVVAGEGEILTIGAPPGERRRGLGRRLLASALLQAGRAGAEAMFLEVAESNAAALSLYLHCGFHQVGRRAGYYPRAQGPAEAALVMRRDLSA